MFVVFSEKKFRIFSLLIQQLSLNQLIISHLLKKRNIPKIGSFSRATRQAFLILWFPAESSKNPPKTYIK